MKTDGSKPKLRISPKHNSGNPESVIPEFRKPERNHTYYNYIEYNHTNFIILYNKGVKM